DARDAEGLRSGGADDHRGAEWPIGCAQAAATARSWGTRSHVRSGRRHIRTDASGTLGETRFVSRETTRFTLRAIQPDCALRRAGKDGAAGYPARRKDDARVGLRLGK